MMESVKNALPTLIVVLLLLAVVGAPVLYLVAYFAMLDGKRREGALDGISRAIIWEKETPVYRWDSYAVEGFFSLAHVVDTRLRPSEWEKGSIERLPPN